MSTAPARTRSVRKPAAETNQSGRSTASDPAETPRERGNVSPSRLPKPPSSTTTSASLPRNTNISRPASSTSNGSTRPPSQRIGVSRPPITSDNKILSLRSGARTPTEANSSLQRAPSTRHTRNSSTSALPSRPPSSNSNQQSRMQLFPPTASTLIRPPSSASTLSNRQDANRTLQRPAFSTLQQHFSPARSLAPKPPTALFLAPPSPSKLPSNIALTAETAKLQAELLQLHLLHRSAAPAYTAYRASARQKLQARFDDVRTRHSELVALESAAQDRGNIRALQAWAADSAAAAPSCGLDDKIHVLDAVLAAVWKLGEPGGRYARAVKRFERWLASVCEILEARKRDPGAGALVVQEKEAEAVFVEELDAAWKAEVLALSRKVAEWTLLLRDLGEVVEGSSRLAVVVGGVRELVRGIGEEVSAMERIEREVVAREEGWRREVIERGDDEEEEEAEAEAKAGRSGAGAIWRMG